MVDTKPRIFLSHSHSDKFFARRVATQLRTAGAKVWFDEAELSIGDSIIDRISDGLIDATHLAIILSPNSVNSKWVKTELQIALSMKIADQKMKVLPLLYRECTIPTFLKPLVYADFRKEKDFWFALNQVKISLGLPESLSEKSLEQIASYDFTYDIQSAVMVIIGSAELIQLELKDRKINNEVIETRLSVAIETAMRLSRNAYNLYYLYAFESGTYTLQLKKEDLPKIVDNALSSIKYLAVLKQQSIDLELNLGQSSEVRCVEWLLEKALYNILENAVHYGAKGSPISLRTQTQAANLIISIENEGPTISDREAEKIFIRGFRGSHGSRGPEGYGLGLYLARLVLEAHGGTVYLDKDERAKTRFLVELPLEY